VVKTITVNAVVKADKISDYTLAPTKGLQGAFVVAMVSEKGLPDQLTFHRPIGWTDLAAEEYVCTPTSDIHTLLAGSEDPREAPLSKLENLVFLELAVRDGLLFQVSSTDDPYPYPNGEDRDLALSRAEKAAKDRIKTLEAEHKALQQGKPKAAVFKHNVTRNQFLNEEHLGYERDLQEHKRLVRAEIRERVPRTYRTLGGPLRDQPQRRCPMIPKGATEQEAKNAVYKTVAMAFLAGSKDPHEDVPAGGKPPGKGHAPEDVTSGAPPTPASVPRKVDPSKKELPSWGKPRDETAQPGTGTAPASSPRDGGGGEKPKAVTPRPSSPAPVGSTHEDDDPKEPDDTGPEGGDKPKPKGKGTVARAKERLKAALSGKTDGQDQDL
jgi:hypothetical protein